MKAWIVLLRGVNVAGGKNNTILMKEFKAMLEGLGYEGVKTYIQSGNAVFKAAEENATALKQQIGDAIQTTFGFLPQIMVLTRDELKNVLDNNPFRQAEDDPKTLMISFLGEKPENPNLAKMQALKTETEAYKLGQNCFYFYAPDGVGRSKLALNLERLLGVSMTARNLRSANKILELAEAL